MGTAVVEWTILRYRVGSAVESAFLFLGDGPARAAVVLLLV